MNMCHGMFPPLRLTGLTGIHTPWRAKNLNILKIWKNPNFFLRGVFRYHLCRIAVIIPSILIGW